MTTSTSRWDGLARALAPVVRAAIGQWTLRSLAVLVGLLAMAATALAQPATYRYAGPNFTTVCESGGGAVRCNFSSGEGAPENGHLEMVMELQAPLAPGAFTDVIADQAPFRLTLTVAGLSTLIESGTNVGVLRFVTDANGNIIDWVVSMPFGAGGGVSSVPGSDQYGLGSRSASGPGGQWTRDIGIPGALSFGSATRLLTRGPLDLARDEIRGGAGTAAIASTTGSRLEGTEAARGQAGAQGPVAGAWSMAANGWGMARGIAYRSYLNDTTVPLTFKVNAVFDGGLLPALSALTGGPMAGGGAIHVFDSQAFAQRLQSAGGDSGAFLLGGYQPLVGDTPLAAFTQLRGLFPTGLLGSGETVLNLTAAGPVTASVTSGFVTVQPHQQFTVMYDVATRAATRAPSERAGSGVASFLNTLKPAAVHFTGLAGEALAGIVPFDSAPAAAPAPTSLGLSPPTAQHPAGGTAAIEASVAANGQPLANVPVEFHVTGGPDAGRTGVAVSDASGVARFAYVGDNDVGKDLVQARIGALASASVEHTWTPARCPHDLAFWVRQPGLWPLNGFSIGGKTYTAQQMLALLKLVPQNASLALLQQDAVTRLSGAAGGDVARLELALLSADRLLVNFNPATPQQNRVDVATTVEMLAVAARLALYNANVAPRTCTP